MSMLTTHVFYLRVWHAWFEVRPEAEHHFREALKNPGQTSAVWNLALLTESAESLMKKQLLKKCRVKTLQVSRQLLRFLGAFTVPETTAQTLLS